MVIIVKSDRSSRLRACPFTPNFPGALAVPMKWDLNRTILATFQVLPIAKLNSLIFILQDILDHQDLLVISRQAHGPRSQSEITIPTTVSKETPVSFYVRSYCCKDLFSFLFEHPNSPTRRFGPPDTKAPARGEDRLTVSVPNFSRGE
jgi:hypothetical protein